MENIKTNMKYFEVDGDKLDERQSVVDQMKIDGCMKQHMFSYFPDGSIQLKENVCACPPCLKVTLLIVK